MTRFTNFARKRTYVQAGFDSEPQTQADAADFQPTSIREEGDREPQAKKRKRVRSRKTKFSDGDVSAAGVIQNEGDVLGERAGEGEGPSDRSSKGAKFGDKGKRGKFDNRYPKGTHPNNFSTRCKLS
ncbi:hypothetical protein GSI_00446 [Ganoderma sinense ZZ0214-1]|uniref:Uncharacterized protein n=1 Tax=Ganoderma sinense ZZ0214-1 TaxID=1077348 RepID=A0A2G8SSL1_9APHY|nr:hypothetical protein GSI_00446 [Ganoderma sinense ZZ0214-1]